MIRPYYWPLTVDSALQEFEALSSSDIGLWISRQKAHQKTDGDLYLLLALASSRWVDHHGPYIGHGTFNGGPLLRAAALLPAPYSRLALVQTTHYVHDLLHHPNYGPYTLMAMDPVDEPSLEESRQALIASIEAGDQPLAAEHRLVGLLAQDHVQVVRNLLLESALRQFSENEHRLLIVHRAAQLLDDTEGWTWAEPIFRASVQYLASRPRPWTPEEASALAPLLTTVRPRSDSKSVLGLMQALVDANPGDEPAVLLQAAQAGMSTPDITEAASLAGADMLGRSGFDAHAVTGIHAVADLVLDPNSPDTLGALGLSVMLTSQRTRRQKAIRSQWRATSLPSPRRVTSADLADAIRQNPSGGEGWKTVAAHLRAGGDAREVARVLMETALKTAGPFDAIHNVKMVWGQFLETQRSAHPTLAWRHLASGAAAVATTMNPPDAEPVLASWNDANAHRA